MPTASSRNPLCTEAQPCVPIAETKLTAPCRRHSSRCCTSCQTVIQSVDHQNTFETMDHNCKMFQRNLQSHADGTGYPFFWHSSVIIHSFERYKNHALLLADTIKNLPFSCRWHPALFAFHADPCAAHCCFGRSGNPQLNVSSSGPAGPV